MVDTPRTSSDVEQIGQYGFRFAWGKADKGYCWEWFNREDLEPDPHYGRAADRVRALRTVAETTGYIETRPLEDNPDLFLEFADIEPTEEGILAFANEHGLLEKRILYLYWEDESDPEIITGEVVPLSEDVVPFLQWETEIRDMADSVRLWQIIKENDNVGLSGLIEVEEDRAYDLRRELTVKLRPRLGLHDIRLNPDIQRRMLPGDLTIPAMLVLGKIVNRKLGDNPAGDHLRLNENNKLEGLRSPASLLSAMWLQFYGWIIGDRNFDTCRVCGKWVDVTNKRPDWKRHSECAANVRARRSNVNGKVKDALRMGQIDETRAKEIESELSEAKTVAALTAVNEKFKAGLEPRKPTAKKPAKKPAAKKKGASK